MSLQMTRDPSVQLPRPDQCIERSRSKTYPKRTQQTGKSFCAVPVERLCPWSVVHFTFKRWIKIVTVSLSISQNGFCLLLGQCLYVMLSRSENSNFVDKSKKDLWIRYGKTCICRSNVKCVREVWKWAEKYCLSSFITKQLGWNIIVPPAWPRLLLPYVFFPVQ